MSIQKDELNPKILIISLCSRFEVLIILIHTHTTGMITQNIHEARNKYESLTNTKILNRRLAIEHISNGMSLMSTLNAYLLQHVFINQCCSEYV